MIIILVVVIVVVVAVVLSLHIRSLIQPQKTLIIGLLDVFI